MAAIVLFDQSKREIDSCAGPGSCIKRAVFNKMPSWLDTQPRETACNIACVTPMGRDFAAVEQPSWRDAVNSSSDRGDAARLAYACQDPLGNPFANQRSPAPARTGPGNRTR